MQVYLDSFGAFLSVQQGLFRVRMRTSGQEKMLAPRDVSALLLTKGTGLSTDAALLAAEHDIPLILIDANTHFPLAQLGHGRPGTIAAVRRSQLAWSRSWMGMQWVAEQLETKIAGQRAHLREWAVALPDSNFATEWQVADRIMARMGANFEKYTPPTHTWDHTVYKWTGEQFRGWEGTASRVYFEQWQKIIGDKSVTFGQRQARPPDDGGNALLNYLYGMLYTSVHLSLLKAGLDPYTGVLHADQYGGTPTLVFDAIEAWRPWADRVALGLLVQGEVGVMDFERSGDDQSGWRLGYGGRDKAINLMLEYLEGRVWHGGQQRRRQTLLDDSAQNLAGILKTFLP
jgi:CRISP-associated protein Cas1